MPSPNYHMHTLKGIHHLNMSIPEGFSQVDFFLHIFRNCCCLTAGSSTRLGGGYRKEYAEYTRDNDDNFGRSLT